MIIEVIVITFTSCFIEYTIYMLLTSMKMILTIKQRAIVLLFSSLLIAFGIEIVIGALMSI